MSAELEPLPQLLAPGLRMVFIGYNPGIESARRGHYYAFRGNVFWRQLSASGLVGREVTAEDDASLLVEAGIGFTDLCARPSARASELTAAEIAEGAGLLAERLVALAPRVAVFSGRGIYALFGARALGLNARELSQRPDGRQPETFGPEGFRVAGEAPGPCRVWVIPSSSGLASRWHVERLALLRELADELAGT